MESVPKNVQETKLRLLREAVEDNVDGARQVRARTFRVLKRYRQIAKEPKGIFPLWLWGCFLIAGLSYLLLPSQLVSTGRATLQGNSKLVAVQLTSRVEPQPTGPDLPHEAPRPLNRAVFPLSVKKIVIDAGHGGSHFGAVSGSGVSEKEITLDLALRLKRLMEQASFEAVLTRESDQTISLQKRVAFANASNADLFVSIHVNWMEPRKLRPLETYFVGPTDDPAVTKLVSMENQESGYSLSDYRQLLEKVYIHTRRDESRRLAETIQGELYYSLREMNPHIHNRGVKMAPFIVLVGTQMPAILVEVSSLSNEDEVKLLTNNDYREKIALALLRGIRKYANSLDGSGKKGS
jgi:N-acetylmuramoyl-L-alanine amidase